jgi:hypothetical protein
MAPIAFFYVYQRLTLRENRETSAERHQVVLDQSFRVLETWYHKRTPGSSFGCDSLGHRTVSGTGGDWNHGIFNDFPFSWECHHPNWLSYFSEGLKPPTRLGLIWIGAWTKYVCFIVKTSKNLKHIIWTMLLSYSHPSRTKSACLCRPYQAFGSFQVDVPSQIWDV